MYHATLEGWGVVECETLDAAILTVYMVMRTPNTTWRYESTPGSGDNPGALTFDASKMCLDGAWINTTRGVKFYTRLSIKRIEPR